MLEQQSLPQDSMHWFATEVIKMTSNWEVLIADSVPEADYLSGDALARLQKLVIFLQGSNPL